MKMFEISNKEQKNGRRHFKVILCRIFPDSCVDENKQIGTMYNRNGITWLKDPCKQALQSIKGMSLRCEFIDKDRTEILGHGYTDIVDGIPVYENAVQIGTFTKGYFENIKKDNGEVITVCCGEGEVDAQCYHNFVAKLDEDIKTGNYPNGSVEIMHTDDNKDIKYRYGYKDFGRIPEEFIFSGYAIIGVRPADDNARLLELNTEDKEEINKMTETEVKSIVSQAVKEYTVEMNRCKKECASQIAGTKASLDKAIAEKNEALKNAEEIRAALDSVRKELEETNKKYNELLSERNALNIALGEAKARERISNMNTAIADFTDKEKSYAEAEINAFKADPNSCEINSIVNKIWEGIGKASKEETAMVEQNSANESIVDIFGEVNTVRNTTTEDLNIF